jgi:hypothetical protein
MWGVRSSCPLEACEGPIPKLFLGCLVWPLPVVSSMSVVSLRASHSGESVADAATSSP